MTQVPPQLGLGPLARTARERFCPNYYDQTMMGGAVI
jgi:hypothetical protein